MGCIDYELNPKTKKLTYQIKDWVVQCSGEPCMGSEAGKKIMIYACDSCHFLFSRTAPAKQCPDCGKESIREATKEEIQEFEQRINANLWDE